MPDPHPIPRDKLLNNVASPASPRPRSREPPPAPPTIPDHELVRCIGRGSYGEVWLARNVMGPWRAVKIVYRRSFDHDRPFERELEGIRRFEPISRSHPSQLNVLHVGRNDAAGCFYYVMELADDANAEPGIRSAEQTLTRPAGKLSPLMDEGRPEGQTAPRSALPVPSSYAPRTLRSDLLHRGRLPFEECLSIGLNLATALDHLHRQGLVHRDIKPSNIIFVNGVPKLADIGLVAAAEHTLSAVGTEGYLPPEGPGTPQADLFSLGKVLYEMATGHDRREYPELPANLIDQPDRTNLAELNEIIIKACQSDPKERYQTAAELHADLALLQSGKSVSRGRIAERRWRLAVRAGALVTGVALLAGGAWLYQRHHAREARRLAQTAQEQAVGQAQRADATTPTPQKILFHVADASTLRSLGQVKLRVRISRDDAGVVEREFRTDAQGLCRVEVPATWTPQFAYEVEAGCDGFVTRVIRWSTEQGDDIDELPVRWEVRLAKAIRSGGFVRNEDGEGIEGVVIGIAEPLASSGWAHEKREQETLGSPSHEERTDASGRWSCTHLPERMEGLVFTLSHPEYCRAGFFLPAAARLVGVPNVSTVDLGSLHESRAVMVMRRGLTVVGTVTDADGHPIAGARVTQRQEGGASFAVETTGPDGRFHSRNAAVGELTLVVEAKGYAVRRVAATVPQGGLTIPIQLQPSKTLKGRVVDESGQPVPEARVQLAWTEAYRWSAKTDRDGRFVYDSAPEEALSYEVSEAREFKPATVSLVGDGEEKLIRLERSPLARRIRVAGRVIDAATRQPVPHFKVLTHEQVVSGLSEMALSPSGAVEGREGAFRVFVDWPVTSYDLELQADGYMPKRAGWFLRREGSRELDLSLERAAPLTGTILLPDGRPAAGAEVGLATRDKRVILGKGKLLYPDSSISTRTDAEGRFSFGPQRGELRVVAVHAAGYREVFDPEHSLASPIVLEPWGRIEGTLRINGSARSNCAVNLAPSELPLPDTPRVSLQLGARSDDQGRFAIPLVPRGEFVVYPVIKNTYSRSILVAVAPGSTQRVDLVVGGGHAITGRFVWAEPGVRIRWDSPNHRFSLTGNPSRPAQPGTVESARGDQGGLMSLDFAVGPDGSFRVDAIPEGTYRLAAWIGKHDPDDPQRVSIPFVGLGAAARDLVVEGPEDSTETMPLDLGVLEVKSLDQTQAETQTGPK
jgi:hypothetical protein